MKIVEATLIGWISPTRQKVGFKLPIFLSKEKSNSLLVQNVDDDGNISNFEPFAIEQPIESNNVVQRTMRKGDLAFWCFGIEGGEHLSGSRSEIIVSFRRNASILQHLPYVASQISGAFKVLDTERSVSRAVFFRIFKDVGAQAAYSWLDAEILSPSLRNFVTEEFRGQKLKKSLSGYLMDVQTITDRETSVCLPEWLIPYFNRKRKWGEFLINSVRQEATYFDIAVSPKIIILNRPENPGPESGALRNVRSLKLQAAQAFRKGKPFLRPVSASYFENETGNFRIACTFSSRYDNKGKRKYWYGFHKTWDDWLEAAEDAYLVLGCLDRRVAFGLPIEIIRNILPSLRATGTGKDKYWHLDIVDINEEIDMLDLPRVSQRLNLQQYAFTY